MHRFREEILQHIWKCRNMKPGVLRSVSGKVITVVSPGTLNSDSGPDFFNARIQVDGIHLAGNIEVHVRTSDWLKHKHQFDPAYDRIILHVVFYHDVVLRQNEANSVEVLELRNLIGADTFSFYEGLLKGQAEIPCSRQLPFLDDEVFVSWLEQLALVRLGQKVQRVKELFDENRGDYSQTFYLLFLRSFGLKVNALPFELLGKSLPLNILLRHADNQFQLEALLLGAAGFLSDAFENTELRKLQNEFSFLQRKYGLHVLDKDLFKFSRLRPANFPTLRLMQLSGLIHKVPELFRAPQLFIDINELQDKMKMNETNGACVKDFRELNISGNRLGVNASQTLIINAFVPFQFFYGEKLNQFHHKTAALTLIKSCKPEDNYKTRHFSNKKHLHRSAFISQGMIQLFDHYCGPKRCLDCEIGEHLLSA